MTNQTLPQEDVAKVAESLLELAERLEQGDLAYVAVRDIEDAIYMHVNGKTPFNCATAPRYSASLDAAMALVPQGWSVQAHLSESGKHPCVVLGRSHPINARIAQEGHTLAATLCAAALRARSHLLGEKQA